MDWLSNTFVCEIANNVEKLPYLSDNVKFSDKSSKPSLSLIDDKLYKEYMECRRTVEKDKLMNYAHLLHPQKKVQATHNKGYGEEYYKTLEVLKYSNLLNFSKVSFSNCSPDVEKCVADVVNIDSAFPSLHIANGSVDNNEYYSVHLLASEILETLSTQKKSSVLVLKIFDIFSNPMAQLIHLLKFNYEKLVIIKPRTSLLTDDKYVVCIGKKENSCKSLEDVLSKWKCTHLPGSLDYCDTYCRDLGIKPLPEILGLLYKYNNGLMRNYIEMSKNLQRMVNLSENEISEIEAKNNKKAIQYCNAYGLMKLPNTCRHHYDDVIQLLENIEIKKCVFCDSYIM